MSQGCLLIAFPQPHISLPCLPCLPCLLVYAWVCKAQNAPPLKPKDEKKMQRKCKEKKERSVSPYSKDQFKSELRILQGQRRLGPAIAVLLFMSSVFFDSVVKSSSRYKLCSWI